MACVKHSIDLIKFTYIEKYYVFLFRRRKIVLTVHRPICSKIMCAGTLIKKNTFRSATTDEFVNMHEFLSIMHTDVHPLRRTLFVCTCVCVCVYIYVYIHTYIHHQQYTHL